MSVETDRSSATQDSAHPAAGPVTRGVPGSAGSVALSGQDGDRTTATCSTPPRTAVGGALFPEAPRLGLLRIRTGVGDLEVTAEPTECEHLRITPVLGSVGELTGDWRLSHAPTGLRVPGTDGLDPRELRDMARLLADIGVLATANLDVLREQAGFLAARVTEARDRVTR